MTGEPYAGKPPVRFGGRGGPKGPSLPLSGTNQAGPSAGAPISGGYTAWSKSGMAQLFLGHPHNAPRYGPESKHHLTWIKSTTTSLPVTRLEVDEVAEYGALSGREGHKPPKFFSKSVK